VGVDENNIGILAQPIKDDVRATGRYVEGQHRRWIVQVRELSRFHGRSIEQPEILGTKTLLAYTRAPSHPA